MQKASSIELLAEEIEKVNLNDNTAKMEALVEQIKLLQQQMVSVQEQVTTLDQTTKVEEYKEVQVVVGDLKDISLEMFKSLPEFNGDRTRYTSWRNSAMNVMKIFKDNHDKPKYFEALSIVRNKITGMASEALTNYNTVFNFDAIISRLDHTYADKRPTYIIEQELIVLQQKSLTVEEFYDEVNKKLNVLINKINMTHKSRGIAEAMVKDASEKALRTFVTGLTGNLGSILYASHPASLPDAYAKLQTIVNDQERIKFANQFNQNRMPKMEMNRINPNFKPKFDKPYQPQQQPFVKTFPGAFPSTFPSTFPKTFSKPEPMDIDKSSMHVNIGKNDKRPRSGEFSNQMSRGRKFQRINQILEANNVTELDAEPSDAEEEINVLEAGAEEEETASVFLDN